jgi:lysozyme
MDLERLQKQLEVEEGKRNLAYKDSKGIWTIGIGHNVQERPISDLAIKVIFEEDVDTVVKLLNKYLPWWKNLDTVRKNALIDLGFNLGVGPSVEDSTGKLLEFKNSLKYLEHGDYIKCGDGFVNSLWYRQVGVRGKRLVEMIRSGEWPEDIE